LTLLWASLAVSAVPKSLDRSNIRKQLNALIEANELSDPSASEQSNKREEEEEEEEDVFAVAEEELDFYVTEEDVRIAQEAEWRW